MGLGRAAKCNIHIGGSYGNKEAAAARFATNFAGLDESIRRRITLENDDKTFTAAETLAVSQAVGVPMVLDIHHHAVNNEGESAAQLWPRILDTWEGETSEDGSPLPPKIHASSPKSESEPEAMRIM